MKKTLFDRAGNSFTLSKQSTKTKSPKKSKENAENEDDKSKDEDDFEDLDTLIKSKVLSSFYI